MTAILIRFLVITLALTTVDEASKPLDDTSKSAGLRFDADASPSIAVRLSPSGHLLVRPLVNGSDVGWFILDTGSSQHIITPDAADEADLEPGKRRVNRSLSGSVKARTWRGRALRLGPALFPGPAFTETDLDEFSKRVGADLAGILGYELLEETVAVLDYAACKLSLHAPEAYEPPDEGVKWLDLEDAGVRPRVKARFEGHSEVFLIDTGDPGSITLYSPAVKRLDLLEDRRTWSISSHGIRGSAKYRAGRLHWFELGGKRFARPRAHFSLMRTGAHAVTDPAGHIGCRLLGPFTVVFDYPRKRVGFISRD